MKQAKYYAELKRPFSNYIESYCCDSFLKAAAIIRDAYQQMEGVPAGLRDYSRNSMRILKKTFSNEADYTVQTADTSECLWSNTNQGIEGLDVLEWLSDIAICTDPEFRPGEKKDGKRIACSYEADINVETEVLLGMTDIVSNYAKCETVEDYIEVAGHDNEHQAYIHIYEDNSIGLGIQVTSPDGTKDFYDVSLSKEQLSRLRDTVEETLGKPVPELKKEALGKEKRSKEDHER